MPNCSTDVIDAYADAPTLCPLAGNFLEEKAGYTQLILTAFGWAEEELQDRCRPFQESKACIPKITCT